MRNRILLLMTCCAMAVSCSKYDDSSLWDKVNDLDSRVSYLERICQEMNTNISSLQTLVSALQTGDYITSVTPIMRSGVEVGYTITFKNSPSITIYHGENGQNGADGQNGTEGQNGADGKDGVTPIIGVALHTDGNYYWTIQVGNNSVDWLRDGNGQMIRANGLDGKDGADGNDGENGKDGQDGSDGKDGEDGKDGQDGNDGANGITPILKIENDYWYVSTDNGATWTTLGKAKGDKGDGGDSFFTSVTDGDDAVVFVLSDGTTITIPQKHSLSIEFRGIDNMVFEVGETKVIYFSVKGGKGSIVTSAFLQKDNGSFKIDFNSAGLITIKGLQRFSNKIDNSDIVIVLASDGENTIMKGINISYGEITGGEWIDGETLRLDTPGGLGKILRDYQSMTTLRIVGAMTSDDVLAIKTYTQNLEVLDLSQADIIGNKIPDNAFSTTFGISKSLATFIFPNGITEIGKEAFKGCEALSGTLTIPESVTIIGTSAFSGCSHLSGQLVLPENLMIIGSGAFNYCSSLTGILTIPTGVTTVNGFQGCSGLSSIIFHDNITAIGDYTFNGCIGLTGELNLPDGLKTLGAYAFYRCTGLNGVVLNNNIVSIGSYAFAKLSGLTGNLNLPNGLRDLGEYAFSGCSGLTGTLVLPRGVSIGNDVFNGCSGFTGELIIEANGNIGYNAFEGCSGFSSLTIKPATAVITGDKKNDIGFAAFRNCTGLTGQITIPTTYDRILAQAFYGCEKITEIVFSADLTGVGVRAFKECPRIASVTFKSQYPPEVLGTGGAVFDSYDSYANVILYVPYNTKGLYQAAPEWSLFANIVGR